MVPFITRWKFGMGFMGEQGAECSFISIERAYLQIPNQAETPSCCAGISSSGST